MAFVQLATLLVANIFMRARLPPRRSGPLVELSAFRELPYSLFTIGMIFVGLLHIRHMAAADQTELLGGVFCLLLVSIHAS